MEIPESKYICSSCFGIIVGRLVKGGTTDSPYGETVLGYHCSKCGVEYHTLPSQEHQKEVRKDLKILEEVQSLTPRKKSTRNTKPSH